MEFVRCMSNYLKIVVIRMVFKFMTMFLNTRGIVRIVCEWFVGQERDSHNVRETGLGNAVWSHQCRYNCMYRHVNLYNNMESISLGNRSLKLNPLRNLFGDENTIFRLIPRQQSRNVDWSFFLIWNEILPKNINGTMTSFLFGFCEESEVFFTNNLSRNFLTHLSMKNKGKLFFCHITMEASIVRANRVGSM